MSLEQALPASDLFTPKGVSDTALSARELTINGPLAGTTRPPGEITMYGTTVAPDGWLLCNGAAVSRSVYASLFNIIGTIYGVGDGSSTFNVPDIQGRMPVGLGTNADVSTLANNDGQSVANRRPKHRTTNSLTAPTHTLSISGGSHSHPASPNGGQYQFKDAGTSGDRTWNASAGNTDGGSNPQSTTHTHPTGEFSGSVTAPGGSIGTNNANDIFDAPSYIVVNFIIKV